MGGRGLKNPIRSMFNSSVRGVVSDYNREHRLLDRIRHLEAQIHTFQAREKHLNGVIHTQVARITDLVNHFHLLEEHTKAVEKQVVALEKILVKQNS